MKTMLRHDCDREIRHDAWAMSGYRKLGDSWVCTCGKVYEFVEDEAEGGGWVLVDKRGTP